MTFARFCVVSFVSVMVTTVSAQPVFPPFSGNPFTEIFNMVQQIRDAVIGDGFSFPFIPSFMTSSGYPPIPFTNPDAGINSPYTSTNPSNFGIPSFPYSPVNPGGPQTQGKPNGFDVPPYFASTGSASIPANSYGFGIRSIPTGPDRSGIPILAGFDIPPYLANPASYGIPYTPASFNRFGIPSIPTDSVGPMSASPDSFGNPPMSTSPLDSGASSNPTVPDIASMPGRSQNFASFSSIPANVERFFKAGVPKEETAE